MSHQHFPNSSLRQSNKSHSGGKHDSKGSIRKRQKGKIEGTQRTSVKQFGRVVSKQDKRAVQQQLNKDKKMAVLDRKRFGTIEGAPKTVAIIALGEIKKIGKLQNLLLSRCGKEIEEDEEDENNNKIYMNPITVSLNAKQRMTIVTVPRETISVLDIAKVADILLLAIPFEEGIDEKGENFISLIKAQGLPNVYGILEGLERVPEKKRHDLKKEHQKIVNQHFPEEPRILPLDNATDAQQVIRFVENCTVRSVHWREHRPYLFVHEISSQENDEKKEFGTVKITGYLRGGNMSANQLVHIPGFGDFQLKKIEMLNDPNPVGRGVVDAEGKILYTDEPNDKQASLVTENIPDLLLNEQTWPTPEELAAGKKKVPKGTSTYQASWIVDKEEEGEREGEDEGEDGEDDENMDNDDEEERGEEDEEEEEEEEEIDMNASDKKKGEEDSESDTTTITEQMRADRSARQETDLTFPDEVDCPEDTPARLRFQKYRGLKSFRTTPWDPKENLPLDYGRIFQFSNLSRSQKNAMDLTNYPIPAGNFVALYVANAPLSLTHQKPIVVGGLFTHENKMTVLQFNVLKHASHEDPVQSKDTLVFHVGIRRYTVQPVFSTLNPGCAKQKFERFLQPGRPSCATIYGPVTFSSNPLIVFTPQGDLVATGTLHAIDPDRIVVKKIVLTGTPAKVHKKGAVIRDLFYFPEDAYWFKPVELWTKNGKVGHIKESVGTHGLVKCTFDTPINQNDTVCLSLYKRIFPKWPKNSHSVQYKEAKAEDEKMEDENEMDD